MYQTDLYEQVAPEEDITAHVHTFAIPFYDEAWPLQPCTWSL